MSTVIETNADIVPRLEAASDRVQRAHKTAATVIFGQDVVIERTILTILSGGHALLIGVPGLAKTLLVDTLGKVLGLDAKRIQFTPDLMPSDIIGSEVLEDEPGRARSFRFIKGPIFTQLLMADEINRASPKTQSALLQAMQERHVTVAGHRHDTPAPFHVLATQNPLEQEGTYPLPEAQLDRFFFKLVVGYSSREELNTIIERTTKGVTAHADKVMDGAEIVQWQQLVREVILAPHVQDYIARLTLATHPDGPFAVPITNQYLRWGSSPRGAQTLTLAAKVRALLGGRYNVSFEDVRRVFLPALRHRVILNFEAEAEGIDTDKVLLDVLQKVPEKAEDTKVA